jgi:hypothetical protein
VEGAEVVFELSILTFALTCRATAQNRMKISFNCQLSTDFHANGHAFTALQAQNWDESLTNFHPSIHARLRSGTNRNEKQRPEARS